MLAQAMRAREQPRNMLVGPTTGTEAAQYAGMLPGFGLLGVGGDVSQYIQQPETRGLLPYALTALGAVPFLGAMAKMAGPLPRGILMSQAGGILGKGRIVNRIDDITEPPIAEGLTRLYRGGNAKGGWYSPSKEVAEHFLFDRGGFGQFRYVDVPDAIATQAAERASKSGKSIADELAHILPTKYREQSKVLAEFDARSGVLKALE